MTGRDFMTSKLWEISHLFNLKLFHSSFNIEKPLHGGVFSFELFIVYMYFYILWMLSLQNYRIFLIFTFSKAMNEKGSISLHSKCCVSTAFYLTCFQIPSLASKSHLVRPSLVNLLHITCKIWLTQMSMEVLGILREFLGTSGKAADEHEKSKCFH